MWHMPVGIVISGARQCLFYWAPQSLFMNRVIAYSDTIFGRFVLTNINYFPGSIAYVLLYWGLYFKFYRYGFCINHNDGWGH